VTAVRGAERFPRNERLKGRRAIQQLIAGGTAREDRLLIIRYHTDRARGSRRVAVTVSRRCPGAVARNRTRRRLREIYRTCRDGLPPSGDFLVIAKADAVEADFSELRKSFQGLAEKLDR